MSGTPSPIAGPAVAARTLESPVGPLTLVVSDAGLRAVHWGPHAAANGLAGTHPLLDETVRQLGDYFAGRRRRFDLPLDPVGTQFQLAAWAVLRDIPYGETISYREQARRLGDPKKARAVGGANGRNPIAVVVPCHRVVGADGTLTGFGGGLDAKARLLALEAARP